MTRPRSPWTVAAAALAAALAASALVPGPAGATFPGRPGAIAFDTGGSIKTISAAGGHQPRTIADGDDPAYSPEGRSIVFVSHGSRELTVARSDGSDPRTVYESHSLSDPCFSADGKRIFFTRDTSGEGYADIWSVRVSGGSAIRLTHSGTANSEIDSKQPQAAANGRFVVFQRSGEIWTMRPDGSRQRKLANGGSPSISPNSHRIAFSRNEHLVLIGAGGGGERIVDPYGFEKRPEELTRSVGWPVFSPSGLAIAFTLKRTNSYGPGLNQSKRLVVYSLTTRRTRVLTNAEVGGSHADWQPLP